MEEQDDELVAKEVGIPFFFLDILTTLLLEGFKLFTNKAYEGKSDPQAHFNDLMELHLVSVECS